MKSTYLNFMGCLLVAGTMSISCRTDNENTTDDMSESNLVEDNAGAPVGFEAGNRNTADMSTPDTDSKLNAARSDTKAQRGSQGKTTSNSVNKAQKSEQGATGKGGYSAPDGTAAENHDGDQYTKHDTTRMPSGSVSIK